MLHSLESSVFPLKEIVQVRFSPGEKVAVGGIGISLAVGVITLVGGILALHGFHPGFLSHIPLANTIALPQLGIGMTATGGSLVLVSAGGAAILKLRENESKKFFEKHKKELSSLNFYQELGKATNKKNPVRYVIVHTISSPTPTITYEVFSSEKQAQKAKIFLQVTAGHLDQAIS